VPWVRGWYDRPVKAFEVTRVADEAGLRAYHGVVAAMFDHDFVGLPADPYDDLLPALAGLINDEPIELWLGTAGGDAVAAASIRRPSRDNLDLAMPFVAVHPAARRQGHGRAMAEAVLARVRELGRTRIVAEVPGRTRHADPAPGLLLAERVGAKPLLIERRRLLTVADVDDAHLADLAAQASASSGDYTLLTWRDSTPAELVDDMAALQALMSTDPPLGETNFEPERWDADRYRSWEQSVRDRNRIRLVAAARHEPSGRLAGFTDIGVTMSSRRVAWQWATIVAGEHRGHRLGLALKTANLRFLRDELPEVEMLNTWNADANSYMIAVNDALGYRPMERWPHCGLELT
jgi:GNAT superfamily N-acetyltransferase